MQNIKTPRIYLNVPEYLAVNGTNIDDVLYTLPVSGNILTSIPNMDDISFTNSDGESTAYIAYLGHNYTDFGNDLTTYDSDIINGDIATGSKQGFSIMKLSAPPTSLNSPNPVGSIVIGLFYDFPHSPDLKLTLSYEYGHGIKEITTKGGNTLTNQYYNKPPSWGSLGAWELGGNPSLARSGRRVWSLNFSYLSDISVFPSTAALTNDESSVFDSSFPTANTLLQEDTFQRVMHLTNGGQLPFIFQSDNTVDATSPSPDQLAICKFDMKSFKFTQVSHKIYNLKCKIKEVW